MKKLIKFIRKYEIISLCVVFCVPFIIGIILTKVLQSDVPIICADLIAVAFVIFIELYIYSKDDTE